MVQMILLLSRRFGRDSDFTSGLFSSVLFWWFNAVVTPDLIPNSAVKHRSGDGTGNGRVASRQNRVFDILYR